MSVDRIIRKPFIGPDWGTVPDKYAPKIQAPTPNSLSIRVPAGSYPQIGADRNFTPAVIGSDWRTITDKYAPKETPPKANSLQLGVDNSHLKPATRTEGEILIPKVRANGAELILDPSGIHGKAIAYMDASIPFPLLAPTEGVNITHDLQTTIGLNGRRETKIIATGRNGAIARVLTQFVLRESTITIKTPNEASETQQTASQNAA